MNVILCFCVRMRLVCVYAFARVLLFVRVGLTMGSAGRAAEWQQGACAACMHALASAGWRMPEQLAREKWSRSVTDASWLSLLPIRCSAWVH